MKFPAAVVDEEEKHKNGDAEIEGTVGSTAGVAEAGGRGEFVDGEEGEEKDGEEKHGTFDWVLTFEELREYVTPEALGVPSRARCLVLGCGTSPLSASLADDLGYDVTSADHDVGCVTHMQRLRPDLAWVHADLTSGTSCHTAGLLSTPLFSVAVDKCTLDCVLAEAGPVAAAGFLCTTRRTLAPRGVLVLASYKAPALMQPLVESLAAAGGESGLFTVESCRGVKTRTTAGFARHNPEGELSITVLRRQDRALQASSSANVRSEMGTADVGDDRLAPADAENKGETCKDWETRDLVVGPIVEAAGNEVLVGLAQEVEAVREALEEWTDWWFTERAPLLTESEEQRVRAAWADAVAANGGGDTEGWLPLAVAYRAIIDDALREAGFSLSDFKENVEEWLEVCEAHSGDGRMNLEKALAFLRENQ
ncbi:hypothetical protein CYMTET_54784 [Cymbomonas tetramitiformis]|uniref:Methyltransferase type 11 domain-containing protein n=1 Tax=Cymbomonas tetramitiformis TaxID=36881 RepID=A0AAE0BEJ2_9CHLO|nr:hypothetical protein CYMTET_54784 [Cymbomonas tetramitiformis]|eukprot:gene22891-27672_t